MTQDRIHYELLHRRSSEHDSCGGERSHAVDDGVADNQRQFERRIKLLLLANFGVFALTLTLLGSFALMRREPQTLLASAKRVSAYCESAGHSCKWLALVILLKTDNMAYKHEQPLYLTLWNSGMAILSTTSTTPPYIVVLRRWSEKRHGTASGTVCISPPLPSASSAIIIQYSTFAHF